MIIKKYTGKTEEEATAAAKKELGNGIVIMNVRPVKRTGFLSFMKAQKVEVTVALEEERPGGKSVAAQTIARPEGSRHKAQEEARAAIAAHVVRPQKEGGAEERQAPPSAIGALARAAKDGKIPPLKVSGAELPPLQEPGDTAKESATVSSVRADVDAIGEKLDSLHSLLEQRMGPPKGESAISKLKESAKKQETTASGAVGGAEAAAAEPSPEAPRAQMDEEVLSFIKLLYNTLLENEVDERYANELTDEMEKIAKPNMSLDYALANVYQKMVLKFGMPSTISPAADGPKAEIFIGPTGVGKTTTIAKLASKLHLQDKKKVALITVDTYRIAAVEQLRTYASIMEVPFRVVYSVEEMKQAAQDFADYDYIMVDTAGHAMHNEEQKNNIAAFIQVLGEEMECDNYLVLSATTKYRDLIEITDTYARMVSFKLLFTKMDETAAGGNLYNIRMHTGASMSYITNGQDVPDDIEEFNAQKIVKGLLGGKKRL